jgi:hypothetical protein
MKQRGAKAAFKRALTLGSIWQAYYHPTAKELGIRAVSIVQGNGVAFKTPKGDSWLRFDDSGADYVNPCPGTFQVYDGDELVLTYQLQVCPL